MSRKHFSTRWDDRNVFPQCHYCNTYKYGEQYKYSLFLGTKISEELLHLSHKIVKFSDIDLKEMILMYKKIVNALKLDYI